MLYKHGIDCIDKADAILSGKKLGLITNYTGLNSKFERSVDIINARYNLIKLFAPEHGLYGINQAGDEIENIIDEKILTNYDNYYDLFMSVANRVSAKGTYDNKNVFITDFIDEVYKLEEHNLLLKRRTDIFNNIINKRKNLDNSCNIINVERKK